MKKIKTDLFLLQTKKLAPCPFFLVIRDKTSQVQIHNNNKNRKLQLSSDSTKQLS